MEKSKSRINGLLMGYKTCHFSFFFSKIGGVNLTVIPVKSRQDGKLPSLYIKLA